MLDFIRRYTTDPVETNPKMAAFIAFIVGIVTDRFGFGVASWLMQKLS